MPGMPKSLDQPVAVSEAQGARSASGWPAAASRDAALHDHVVVVEGCVEQVVQAKRDEHALEEDKDPHPRRARAEDDLLEDMHAHLDFRPCQHHCARKRQHRDERDHVHEGGPREDPQPLRQVGVKEPVVEHDHHAGDEQHSPGFCPGGVCGRNWPHDGLGGEERAQPHHDPREGEEHGRREERAAKPLDCLHHAATPSRRAKRTVPRAPTL